MADASIRNQYLPATMTVPAGTLRTAPISQTVITGLVELFDVRLLVPPGHCGQTGFAIAYNGRRILPYGDNNGWILADGERMTFDLGSEITAKVSMVAYNEGKYDHTFYVLFHVDVLIGGVGHSATILPL